VNTSRQGPKGFHGVRKSKTVKNSCSKCCWLSKIWCSQLKWH